MATAIEKMGAQLAEKRNALAELFTKHRAEDGGLNMDAAVIADVQAKNAELTDLGKKFAEARDLDELAKKNAAELEELNRPAHPSQHGFGRKGGTDGASADGRTLSTKSLGELVLDSKAAKGAYAAMKDGTSFKPFTVVMPDINSKMFDTKSVMAETSGTNGYAPPNFRTNIVVWSPQRRPVVADLIPQDPTDLQIVKYMLETTYTNASAPIAEGAVAPQSLVSYTEQDVVVQAISTILPVTDQQLEDVPALNGVINNRLQLMMFQTEEVQLLTGSGTSPNLQGFLTEAGVLGEVTGTDSNPDAIFKAFTQVRWVGFADPSGVIIHPTNWQTIRLLKATTGQYIWGDPSTPGPDMVFGVPAIVTPAITLGTALTGDFLKFSHISRRKGMTIEVGYINDDFARNQKTVRAIERLSLEIYRPQAFCAITGLN